jgi:hypothetical protein
MSPRFLIPAALALSLAVGARAEAAKVVGKITVTDEFHGRSSTRTRRRRPR